MLGELEDGAAEHVGGETLLSVVLLAMFRIERTIKDAKPFERLAVRDRESAPVLARFFEWCDAEAVPFSNSTNTTIPSSTPSDRRHDATCRTASRR